ncbi:LOW QUALITY PROTEIN: uncharacterized protein LOC118605091, partial [Rousettus aegyptiacus]|uniref:LOW QUALITY PROTEIN: uncharacterized protein LOC118605091 n=1 Tax=Rousettus aegyptiacus TaxID=9407 RepID=UPI00168D1A27
GCGGSQPEQGGPAWAAAGTWPTPGRPRRPRVPLFFPEPPGHRTRVQRPQLCFLPSPGRPVVLSEQVHQAASFTPTHGSRRKAAPKQRTLPSQCSLQPCFHSEQEFPLLLRPGRDPPDVNNALTLTKCYFGTGVNCNLYSAAFYAGKEPTLMVPSWQRWAVKRRTICCLLSGLVSTGACACTRVCACMSMACAVCLHARARAVRCVRVCGVCNHMYVWVHTGVRGVRVRPWEEGVRKRGSGHFCSETPLPSQGRPCRLGPFGLGLCRCPPGLARPRSAGVPGRPPGPEGSRGRRLPPCSRWLRSSSHGSVSVPSPRKLP